MDYSLKRTMSHRLTRPLFSALFLLLMLGVARPALAHGYLLRSIPEEGTALERPPARLQYWFSEGLEPEFSSLTVRDQRGNVIAEGGVAPENTSLLTARLPQDMPDGAYIVDMRIAFASDGHVTAQSRVFFIGEAVSGVTGQRASDAANPLEIVWRAMTLASTLLLFGVFTLYAVVLVPAWGSPQHRAGWLPPRLMRRLSRVVGAAFIVALLGNLLGLLQQSMVFFNADVGQVISGGLWSVVRAGTRFGELWTARMLFTGVAALAFAASVSWRDDRPATVRPFWTANAWALALALGTFSAGSHAAGSLLWPWPSIMVDWLHILAVGFWAGGLGALVLALPPALEPYSGEARRLALLAVLRRFSRLATGCLALVITTGIYSALIWLNTPSDVTSTTYGVSLAVKLLLVAGLLAVGAAHQIALYPARYHRWMGGRFQTALAGIARRMQSFLPTLRLEAVFALLVVISVGWLSATPVPIPASAEEGIPPLTASQTVDGLEATLTITPGGPGINSYDLLVRRDGQLVENLEAHVQLINPTLDQRGAWHVAEDAGGGLYIAAGADIDSEGEWWALVDLPGETGPTRAAFTWTINDAATVEQSKPPTLLNVLALVGVLVAVGWILYPSAYALYKRLDLSPAAVTVSVSAVVLTIVVGVIGFALLDDANARYEATLNPPPKLINPQLPDAESLGRGQVLFESACAEWPGMRELNTLVERLPRSRDEELYGAVQDGWRGLPACSTLTDAETWDVVNALRALEIVDA